jgi:hypothetical protein
MNPSDTLPIQFGVPLDQTGLLFFACLLAGIGLVYLFCLKKFAEPSITGNGDYVYQLLPRQLATHEEYTKGFLTYFGLMALTVILLSLIGPKNLGALGIALPDTIGYVVVPLAVAMILVGVVPNVPVLQDIETRLRQYAHQQAYIPAAALATAERLAAANFNFASYEQGDALGSPEMRGVEPKDFTASRRSLEHDWARLACLVYEQKFRRLSGLFDVLDAGLLRDYERDLESIEDKKQSMEAEVAAYRAEKAKNPGYSNDGLRRTIRANLYKLYVLLGCAVRLKKQPHDDINLALQQFGFELDQTPAGPNNADLKLVGLAVIAGSVLLLGFDATLLGHLDLWTLSPVFPQTFSQPFLDTVSTLVPHGAAIMIADLMRTRAIKNRWWFAGAGSSRRRNIANYIRVAVVCGVAGYLGLVLWGLAFQSPTLAGLKIDAPNALLAMVTGGFYVWHLDNVELDARPSRVREIGSQAILTGICGLIAATASWDIILGSAGLAVDRIILTAVINTAVGAVLAWYIPAAARTARPDPLVEAKEERIRTLAATARARFADPAVAADWCERPHPALGNKSPSAAAADVEGFEHAISLLQRPQAVAV